MGSVWNETSKRKTRPTLEGDIRTDALIIGGGMAGVLIAHSLTEAGLKCIVVEAKTIGSGATGNTTAKITAQHGLIYSKMISRLGTMKAKLYYEANKSAIDAYRSLSEEYACCFEEKTAYVYSTDNRKVLEQEAKAYHQLGVSVRITDKPPLPFKTSGALALDKQAQFNPLRLLYAVADKLEVYENTFIHKVENYKAYADKGIITAKYIVIASHYPLINIPGLYFMKLYQHRSYVLALEGAPLIDGMYIDERKNGHSFRTYGDLLFIGGGDHKTGKRGGGYSELKRLAAFAYPNAVKKYQWAAQDCMTLDDIPYIGRHRPHTNNVYVATGFNKWGMTGSMVAASLIRDLIVYGKNELHDIYSPQRSMLTKQLFVNLSAAATGLLGIGGPRCTHMGCKLRWNRIEKTWDCPCHGSRFSQGGHVRDNPAKRRLRR